MQQTGNEMSKQLEGKTAVVTGGTTGIGLGAAKRLAEEGAHVFLIGRREEQVDAAVADIGANATGLVGDVTTPDDLDRLYEAVRARGQGLDIVFANAGGGEFATLDQVTEKHFDDTFGLNVKALLFTVQKALPLLNEDASIILNASTAGTRGTKAFGVYGASKAAVRSLARTWAAELAERKVRVNAISPGPIETPGMAGLAPNAAAAEELKAELTRSLPLGRMGRPEEVGNVVVFLASAASSFMTGTDVFVDGGQNQV